MALGIRLITYKLNIDYNISFQLLGAIKVKLLVLMKESYRTIEPFRQQQLYLDINENFTKEWNDIEAISCERNGCT